MVQQNNYYSFFWPPEALHKANCHRKLNYNKLSMLNWRNLHTQATMTVSHNLLSYRIELEYLYGITLLILMLLSLFHYYCCNYLYSNV